MTPQYLTAAAVVPREWQLPARGERPYTQSAPGSTKCSALLPLIARIPYDFLGTSGSTMSDATGGSAALTESRVKHSTTSTHPMTPQTARVRSGVALAKAATGRAIATNR